MTVGLWALIVGVLLTTMALAGSLLRRLPLSTGMLYLAVGVGLGPAGWAILSPDPLLHAEVLERAAEVAVLISLFAVGLKLGLPLSDKRWRLPLRLASLSMLVTIALVTVIGVVGLDLSWGAAILLAAIVAPTDPVLASDVQVLEANDRDRLRFSLSAEGGLNDGAAFPFVMLGLGLLGLHDLGGGGWRWLALDVVWAIAGGLVIGGVAGRARRQARHSPANDPQALGGPRRIPGPGPHRARLWNGPALQHVRVPGRAGGWHRAPAGQSTHRRRGLAGTAESHPRQPGHQ